MSRDQILKRIAQNKPELQSLPEIPDFAVPVDNLLEAFKEKATEIGCQWMELSDLAQGAEQIKMRFPEAKVILSRVGALPIGNVELKSIQRRQDLQNLDVAIFLGQLGVAENAAIWLSEKELGLRVTGFITQHVVICLDKRQIVWNMYQAYQMIRVEETGFGVWMAGPSKTGDIEQALVIGAQGPRSLTIILY